jgi:hypothetical protein
MGDGEMGARPGRGPTKFETDFENWTLDWRLTTGLKATPPAPNNDADAGPPASQSAEVPSAETAEARNDVIAATASIDNAAPRAKVSRKAKREGRTEARSSSPFSKIDPDLGLSIDARLRMVEGLTGKSQKDFEVLRKAAAGDTGHLSLQDRITLTLEVFFETEKRRVDPQVFATAVFEGPRAVDDLRVWLTTGELRLGHRTQLLPERKLHANDARLEVLQQAIDFINSDTLTPILRVSGDGMGEGLRAFASALKDRLADEDVHGRAVLYLPISRAAPRSQDPKDSTANEGLEEKVSYARLVSYLLAFYQNLPIDRTAPPLNAHEIRAALDFIRMEMARRPCVLVLDGWAAFSGPLPALGSILVDDGLNAILEELTHPYREPGQAHVDPAVFLKNRFVILAASAEQIDSPFIGKSLSLPAPSSGNMVDIVKSQGRTRLRLLAPTLQTTRTELILAMTQYLADQAELGPGVDAVEPNAVLYPVEEDPLRARVANDIRSKPFANLLFTIVVLMPDGVRRTTLERIIAAWREIWPKGKISPAWDVGQRVKGEIDTALKLLGPLLVAGLTISCAASMDARWICDRLRPPPSRSPPRAPISISRFLECASSSLSAWSALTRPTTPWPSPGSIACLASWRWSNLTPSSCMPIGGTRRTPDSTEDCCKRSTTGYVAWLKGPTSSILRSGPCASEPYRPIQPEPMSGSTQSSIANCLNPPQPGS